MKRSFLFALVLVILVSACGPVVVNITNPGLSVPVGRSASFLPEVPAASSTAANPQTGSISATLTIFGAASLKNAFTEIGRSFESANPGVKLIYNFGASNALRTQIEHGAETDLFASANMLEMDALVAENLVAASSVKIFMTNRLIVITPANNPAQITKLEELTKDGLKIILAAKEVPAGNYALQILDKLDAAIGSGYKQKVLKNVVSFENDVKQVVAKVQLGEADAGIVYLSDSVAAPSLQKIEIPVENNVIAKYPLAVLNNSRQSELARKFIEFVLSAEGQGTLQKWGFLPVQ